MTNRKAIEWAEQFNLEELCEDKHDKGITHEDVLVSEGELSLWMVECEFIYTDKDDYVSDAYYLEHHSYKVELYNDEKKIKTYEY